MTLVSGNGKPGLEDLQTLKETLVLLLVQLERLVCDFLDVMADLAFFLLILVVAPELEV